jgi:hypothetical protein
MGYESCVLINHDFLDRQRCEQLGRHIAETITLMGADAPRRFLEGLAIYSDHADATRLIVVGGHIAKVLQVCAEGNPADENHQLDLVRHFVEKLGYRLTRMPTKKGKPRAPRKGR